MKVLLFLVMCCSLLSGCKSDLMIIAHRGNSSYAPENTMASVESAWLVEVDAVEIDVHLTSDNKVVVMHDRDTQRVAGEKLVIADSTYEELKKLDIGSFKSWYFRGEKIPLLEDVIDSIPANRCLFVEVKSSSDTVPYLKEIFSQTAKRNQLVVISFNKEVLVEVRKQMPDIPVYWLVGSPKDSETGKLLPYSESLIDTAIEHGFAGLNLNFQSLDREYVALAHSRGIEVYVWTVNYFGDAQRMFEIGVDGITTDYPADLNFLLKK